jgi:hypothetical protein
MLDLIKTLSDNFLKFLSEDPVRPHIPHIDRIGDNKDIFVMRGEDDSVTAITCVSYQNTIPTSEGELFQVSGQPDTAVFYTIWSYKPGAGRQLIFESVKYIKDNKPHITRFITLSPKTEMARRFHLKNGAIVFRENGETVNYEYVSSL